MDDNRRGCPDHADQYRIIGDKVLSVVAVEPVKWPGHLFQICNVYNLISYSFYQLYYGMAVKNSITNSVKYK